MNALWTSGSFTQRRAKRKGVPLGVLPGLDGHKVRDKGGDGALEDGIIAPDHTLPQDVNLKPLVGH